jgi:ribA/ribD-fused uncharacterized protein
MATDEQMRIYKRGESVVFLKVKEEFGGLSNMADYRLRIPVQNSNTGVTVLTTEALYQACRYPHLPDLQRTIIDQKSPMAAKMKSKPHRAHDSRADWNQVRVKIMRWCLRVKLATHWSEFSRLLLATRDKPIVEQSAKDDFWGAKVVDDSILTGKNVLGRLLMELREEIKAAMEQGNTDGLRQVQPLEIEDFLLYGQPILAVDLRPKKVVPAP